MSNENAKHWYIGKIYGSMEYATENFKIYIPKILLSEIEIKEVAVFGEWKCEFIDNGDYWTKDWHCVYFYKGEYKPIIIPILKPSIALILRKAGIILPPPKQANKEKIS